MFAPPRSTREFLPTDEVLLGDEGMATVEYVLCALAAAAIAGVLVILVGSDTVVSKFGDIIDRALSVP